MGGAPSPMGQTQCGVLRNFFRVESLLNTKDRVANPGFSSPMNHGTAAWRVSTSTRLMPSVGGGSAVAGGAQAETVSPTDGAACEILERTLTSLQSQGAFWPQ